MFKTAELEHVDTLHHYGRQLAVLRRIYQSYDRIIERLLERQRVLANAASLMGDQRNIALRSIGHDSDKYFTYGIPLATSAVVRFETLRDRIRLYALSEIQECLDEKDALVQVVSFADLCADQHTKSTTELQPNRQARSVGNRDTDKDHHSSSQAHHPLLTSQSSDCLLFHWSGEQPELHHQDFLDIILCHVHGVFPVPRSIWYIERYTREQADISVTYENHDQLYQSCGVGKVKAEKGNQSGVTQIGKD